IVMPFLSEGTLRSKLDRGRFPWEATVELGRQIARALAHAHERGLVHRDLKPENVLFDVGRPLITDLSLAKHFNRTRQGGSESQTLSGPGDVLGTVSYMAPEQLEDSTIVGPAADVFSLGAILYECLTGRPAFPGESIAEVVLKTRVAEV